MHEQSRFESVNRTKSKVPSLPVLRMKNDILGENYSLSLAYVTKETMRRVNSACRGKDQATNVLSFSFSEISGELLLCPEVIKTQTEEFGRNERQLAGFLVIHGMLHLKGMQHNSKMERQEAKYDQKYFHRGGSGIKNDESRGGRIRQGRKKS